MQKESKRAVKGTEKPVARHLKEPLAIISHYLGSIYLYMIEADTYILLYNII